ncbi:MAG: serine/threonine-protein kinase [Pirellulales bacterium]
MSLLDRLQSLFSDGKVNIAKRFERKREAVSGTMSKFYMARDRKTDRIVGLKVLDRDKTIAFEARFKGIAKPTEGQIAMQLDHPRLVKTFEHGLTSEDQQYLVMEFLEGEGLNSLIHTRSAKLSGQRLTLARQAAEAVAALHAAGFIHRDVCPRNFVVDPRMQSLKLIDFGLTLPDTPPFRQPGNRTGTPRYMAPEIVRRKPTDQRIDIFSLGVTLYELFAQENPWPSVVNGQDAMVHGTEPPTPILDLRPDLNPELAKLIHDCLQAEPNRRPATMKDVVYRLGKIDRE